MPINVMVDIETLSTAANATMLTLGACTFDLGTGEILDTISLRFSLDDQSRLNRDISDSTMAWWKKQSDESRAEAFDQTNAEPLNDALQKFDNWLVATRKTDQKLEMHMWANDPDFDLVILTSAFRDVGKEPPWQFWESRSVRTMKMLGAAKKVELPKREGTHHNAVDDAIHQTKVVSAVWDAVTA